MVQTIPYKNELENGTAVAGLPDEVVQFVHAVREFMRDHPDLNRLQKEEAHSDRLIIWAIMFTLDDYNSAPPPVSVTFRSIPKMHLLWGCVAFLLESRAILCTRNSMRYVDGSISVDIDNAAGYIALANQFRAQYNQARDAKKISINASQAFGSVESEYSLVNALWGIL